MLNKDIKRITSQSVNVSLSAKLVSICVLLHLQVFQAFDGKRICAIKYVNLEEADDFIVQSYINEVQLLERLQGNDNIVKLYDW